MSPKLPVVTAKRFIKALENDGFIKTRQSGSHAVFKREVDGVYRQDRYFSVGLPAYPCKKTFCLLTKQLLRPVHAY